MRLMAGTQLGPYEVLSALGAGGMGEVYRARDPRLGRNVAVKVLPESASNDPDYLRRFDREARAASALNHPNVLVVHDVGTHEGSVYIVSELLEGETLRARLGAGPIPPRKALEIGTQITRGLAAAHAKGILHRDLKPENLFITRDGRVKILDFGLAKVLQTEPAGSEMATATQATGSGTILGTVGYMSPEQVRGLPADECSDIFSLGAVLYEMLSGQRAFPGDTAADRASAILHKEPPELSNMRPEIPPVLGRIVERCLEKEAERRFHSAHDLTLALEAVSMSSASSAGLPLEGPTLSAALRRHWPRTIALAVAVITAVAGAFLGGRMTGDRPVPSVRQLTFRSGYVATARLAPDGRTVVYGAAWDGGPVELYSVRRESPESKSLGLPPAGILAISSSGEMAVSLGCFYMEGFGDCRGTLAVVPMTGGAPRELLENVVGADWSPDGKELAVARIIDEEKFRLEFPLGTLLYESSGSLVHPRVSPRSDLVAFIEHPPGAGPWGTVMGSVVVVDRRGARRTLATGFQWGSGLAWDPDGREVWFSGSFAGSTQIHAVTLRGRDRLVDRGRGRFADIGPQGQALLVRSEGRVGIRGLAPGETHERDLSWFNYSLPADLSADGRTLLIDERGAQGTQFGVYLRKTDGSPAIRLGDGIARGLSPDGKWAITQTSLAQMTLLPTGAGSSRVLPSGPIEEYEPQSWRASWMPDNRRVLLLAKEHGHDWRCYIQDIEDGQIRAVTPEGVEGDAVSPDGRFVAAAKGDRPYALYPLDGGPARPVPGLGPDDEPVRWSRDGRALYVVRRERLKATLLRLDVSSGRREVLRELEPSDPAGILAFATRIRTDVDGRSYVYSYGRHAGQLYLAEGLR